MAQQPNDLFIQQYIDFCESPLRDEADIRADLERLCALPMVKLLAFADEMKVYGTLMIGLNPLLIINPATGFKHFIGNFIVYTTRYRTYPVWHVDFRLVNLDPFQREERRFFHPHMMINTDDEIGDVADICISEGRYPIFQYIRKGQLDLAVELIVNLLETLGPDRPFMPISEWPVAKTKRRRPWYTQIKRGQ